MGCWFAWLTKRMLLQESTDKLIRFNLMHNIGRIKIFPKLATYFLLFRMFGLLRTPIDFFVYVQCSQVKTYRMGLCIGWNFVKSKFTIKEIVYVWWRQIESNAQRVVPIDCWSQRFFWWKKYIRYIIVGLKKHFDILELVILAVLKKRSLRQIFFLLRLL